MFSCKDSTAEVRQRGELAQIVVNRKASDTISGSDRTS